MKLLPPPMAADPATSEVLPWLKTLPLAPEYHPTLSEFEDPIAYILKIEKEASRFGICKIIPPIPAASKKTAVANLNRSFAARNPNNSPTFTSRQQQIGFCPRRPRPVKKPVWQSGENYTLQQFEAKAKQFERTQFKKTKKKGIFTPLEIETLFWKACADKPFSVEYANDMPGSGFGPIGTNGKKWRTEEEKGNVGDTAWNMRGVSRAKGSLLRFMKEEIPGVTSPMAYVAMMFSWFAWHVEDHDLHSLNYLHLGAGKTWYGVPRDARLAFEEVVRVHGYGGEVNPLVTFAILGEKTTVMSPEVFIGAGIPCCRLVQNAGEFVVTFPGSYHSGFSHGFNCGEAANIATPEWLKVAKEAAIRRASTNYPPMVSHFQLLYALVLSLCQRMPISSGTEPRSSRLKDKMRGEGEIMVKEIFVQNVIQNNMLLSVLLDHGSSCVVLSQNTSDISSCSSSLVKSQIKVKPRMSLGLCSRQEAMEMPTSLSDDVMLDKNAWTMRLNGFCSVEGNSVSLCQEKKLSSTKCSRLGTSDFYSSGLHNVEGEKDSTLQGDGLLDQGLLSCVTCGILSFACVAVIQPREAAARYFMSADCSSLNDQIAGSMIKCNVGGVPSWKRHNYDHVSGSGQTNRHVQDSLDDNLANCSASSVQGSDQNAGLLSDTAAQEGVSALDLLASAYGDSSDSEEEALHHMSVCTDANDFTDSSLKCNPNQKSRFPMSSENLCSSKGPREEVELHLTAVDCQNAAVGISENPLRFVSANEVSVRNSVCITGSELHRPTSLSAEDKCEPKVEFLAGNRSVNPENVVQNGLDDDREMAGRLIEFMGDPHSTDVCWRELHSSCPTTAAANDPQTDIRMGNPDSCCDSAAPSGNAALTAQFRNIGTSIKNSSMSAMQRSDKDSSRMHVFCLEHAAEVEKQLHPIGGVHIMLLCHPEYPKIEAEAKLLAKELGINHLWKDIPYRDATEGDQERIQTAMEDEEAIPMNSDWAVKLGINLYYSANLSKSPLYSKQMPYNSVIYKSFGHDSPCSSPVEKPKGGGRSGMQKKKVVAGKWCGKVWMSNQVHPYLAHLNDAVEHDQCSDEKPESETYTEQVNAKPNSLTNNTPSTRKSGKKRKKQPLRRKRSTKKPRFPKLDDNSDIVEDVKNSSPQCGRFLRSCNGITARQHKSNLKDEVDEGGPSSCLRRRRQSRSEEVNNKKPPTSKKVVGNEKSKKARGATDSSVTARDEDAKEYPCDIEGCGMNFGTKQDLALHKKNVCPVRGCGKKFFSHKYLVQHRKVHLDERPLKCPWKGCKMTFKWAWARTEHIRVHTGDRPYVCREAGCSQTFRFVSDFSRHKRKTGHSAKKGRG